jgi:hypothetical protein
VSTTWVPMTRFEPRSWLLANGEVIEEPPLEQTSSGRKIRVTGTTASFYAKDLEDLLGNAAKQVAQEKGTTVFAALTNAEANERAHLPAPGPALLHLNQQQRQGTTQAWWKFRHPDMPYSVTILATMREDRYFAQTVQIYAIYQTPFQHNGWVVNDARFENAVAMEYALYGVDANHRNKWLEFYRDNPVDWANATINIPERRYTVSRQAVEVFMGAVRTMEDLDSIEWFDFRDLANPAYMTLELYDSNVSSQFVSELTDYLDGAAVDKAKALYDQLLESLRSCGVVLDSTENDFERALNSGTLTFTAKNLPDKDEAIDHAHSIVVNIATGTMVVECANSSVNKNEIAEAWEEAKTVAALTGQEDELLAYAREYASTSAKRRTKQILKERGA